MRLGEMRLGEMLRHPQNIVKDLQKQDLHQLLNAASVLSILRQHTRYCGAWRSRRWERGPARV